MSNADIRGRFMWHELMTTDPGAAGTFYSSIMPWKTQPSGVPAYTLWMSGKTRAGGLMALPEGEAASGTPPHWIIYIGTPDVDATVETARRVGGRVLKAPADIPNVGRFAVLSDPQGAAFAVFTPSPSSGDGAAMPSGGVGDFTWHELATTDLDSALSFYSELFGWSKGHAHDMGPMGIYQLISHGGQDIGGIYKARDASTPPNWLSYARVPDVSKAANAVKSGGGRILNGPMEVPGGSWIVVALDPQGGAFAVVEAPKPAAAKPPQPASAPKKSPAATKGPEASKPAASSMAERPRAAAPPKPASAPTAAKSPSAASAPTATKSTGAASGAAASPSRGSSGARATGTAKKKSPARKAARGQAKGRKAAARGGARKSAAKRGASRKTAVKRGKTAARGAKTAGRTGAKKRSTVRRGRSAAKSSARRGRRHR